MNELNKASSAVPEPERVKRLPISKSGFRQPWFVTAVGRDGEPDFRPTSMGRVYQAISKDLCWVCGQKLGVNRTFCIGPMCAINRVTAEPPMHRECAEYAVQVCPFMAKPKAKRNTHNLPEGAGNGHDGPGLMIQRNPGVVMLWHTRKNAYKWFRPRAGGDGFLFKLTVDPLGFDWYAEGRVATEAEVRRSVETGLPILFDAAKHDGDDSVVELQAMIRKAESKFFRMAA